MRISCLEELLLREGGEGSGQLVSPKCPSPIPNPLRGPMGLSYFASEARVQEM